MTQGRWKSKIDKVWQSWMWWNLPLCKWHTFWMAPSLICYFVAILFYIERKWLLMRTLAIILSLENFSVLILLMKVSKYWKIAEFLKISIEMKNRKTSYKAQTASRLRKFFSVPPPHIPPAKILLRLRNKTFLREICRNI